VDIAIEFPVGVKTIRANRASQLNIILNEAVEGFSIKVLDKGHYGCARSFDPFAIGLCGNDLRCPKVSSTSTTLDNFSISPALASSWPAEVCATLTH
jgi:hypothetical protein